jgi:hypothetical protein
MHEEFEDTKGATRSNKSKDRQYTGQNKKQNKRTKQYPHNTAQHTNV